MDLVVVHLVEHGGFDKEFAQLMHHEGYDLDKFVALMKVVEKTPLEEKPAILMAWKSKASPPFQTEKERGCRSKASPPHSD